MAAEFCIPATSIGYLAGIFVTLAFIPQALTVYNNKSAKGLSMVTIVLFLAGQVFLGFVGIMTGDTREWAIALINGVLYSYLLYAKLYYNGGSDAEMVID